MKLQQEKTIDKTKLTEFILKYFTKSIFPPILKGKVNVVCKVSEDYSFNAVVQTTDFTNFTITVNNGVVGSLIYVINNINSEDIDEEIAQIAKELLNEDSVEKIEDVYRVIVYGAVFFVVLHELAHIFRGHFKYSVENNLYKFNNSTYNFKEITDDEPQILPVFEGNFIKLAEVDADISAINIYFQVSVELFAIISDFFEEEYPDWRIVNETPKVRNICNKVAYYASSLALSLIESSRNNNKNYPMPLTRFLDISDAYRQEIYDFNGILKREYGGNVQHLHLDATQEKVQEEHIYMPFLSAMDIIIESSKVLGTNIVNRFGTEEISVYEKLYFDFWTSIHSFESNNLKTTEGNEYQYLRNLRPDFYAVFSQFVIF